MAEFPKSVQRAVDRQISGHEGVVSRQIGYLLTPSQLADAVNVRLPDQGKFRRRFGAASRGGFTGLPFGGMYDFKDGNGNLFFTGIWGNKLYKSAGGGGWLQIASGESFTSNLYVSVPGRIQGRRALGFTVAEDASSPGRLTIYDVQNDTATRVTLVTGPRALAFFQQRFWVSSGDDLYWSDILSTAGFSTSYVLAAEPGIGGNITALIPSRDVTPKLYVLKDEAIMILDPRWGSSSALIPSAGDALDTINTSFPTLTVGIGCVATKSAIWVPGNEGADVLFLAQDGIRGLRRAEQDAQAGAGFPESYGIEPWIGRINFDAAHKATATLFDNAYHLAVPLDGATENTHVLRRETSGNAWSLIDWQAKDMKSFRLGGGHRMFFQNNFTTTDSSSTGTSADNLYQAYRAYTTEKDPGATHVRFSFQTRAFVFDDPQREKLWDVLTFQVSSTNTAAYELQYRVNFGVWNTLATETLPGSSDTVVLGEDPLVWNASSTLARRRQFDLTQVTPGHAIEFKFQSITGATESGTLTFFMIDVGAYRAVDVFEPEA